MDGNKVVRQVGKDIETFTFDDLKKAIIELENHKLYADDLMETINTAHKDAIGLSLFMWLCRYLELEILKPGEKIEL